MTPLQEAVSALKSETQGLISCLNRAQPRRVRDANQKYDDYAMLCPKAVAPLPSSGAKIKSGLAAIESQLLQTERAAQQSPDLEELEKELPRKIELGNAFARQIAALEQNVDKLVVLFGKEVTESITLLDPGITDAPTLARALPVARELMEELRQTDLRLQTALTSLGLKEDGSTQNGTNTDPMLEFFKTTTVRITAVILIVFLVQILVNLFRYSTRLAAFYEARADALEFLAAQNLTPHPDDYHKMVLALAPDGLDFGKAPRSPVDQAVEMARDLAMAAKKT